MIRFFTFKHRGVTKGWCKIKGTPEELMKETGAMIHTIYSKIAEKYPDDAEAYKAAIIVSILDSKSPVWKENDDGK